MCPEEFPLDPATGLCADGSPPQSTPPPIPGGELSADEETGATPETPSDRVPPPATDQTGGDTNGDGVIDESDSQVHHQPHNMVIQTVMV